ncbi:hypothetical protein [Anaeromyxobacter terrae]|uniref:hypothetical protein n=1 Tax=Anaeromyxobacter terrae TaxID=2925406 RepID=UPI001F598AC9|nr:hypothetical protein [Anaeromyxobacter sp. SG22]
MLTLVAAVLLAAAQPGPPARAEPVEARGTDAAARYDTAMALLLDGKLEEAARAFDAVVAAPDAGPLADRARTLAEVSRALSARGQFVLHEPGLERPRPARRARLDRSGRGELAFFGTTYGIWTGVASGLLAGADDGRVYSALAIAGGAGGLALAILPTRHASMPEGRAQAIESATNWGTLNGGLLAALADADGKGVVGATLGTGLAALGTTALLTRERSPSSGEVALTNSGGIWGLVTGGLTLAILEDAGDKTAESVLLASTDAGLLAMALVARRVEMSRGRSLIIDAGGLLGTLAGVSVPAFANAENGPAIGAAGLAGMAVGLAVGTYISRGWDEEHDEGPAARAGAMAMPVVARLEGGGFSAGVAGRF